MFSEFLSYGKITKEFKSFMLGVVADPVALAKYRLWSIDRNDKSRC